VPRRRRVEAARRSSKPGDMPKGVIVKATYSSCFMT